MATKVNFSENNPKKDLYFKRFVIFLLITIALIVISAIAFDKGGDGEVLLVFGAITGLLMLYNFIMYRYNK